MEVLKPIRRAKASFCIFLLRAEGKSNDEFERNLVELSECRKVS